MSVTSWPMSSQARATGCGRCRAWTAIDGGAFREPLIDEYLQIRGVVTVIKARWSMKCVSHSLIHVIQAILRCELNLHPVFVCVM